MQATHSQDKLNEHIQLVRDLLNKQKLIETMVDQHESRNRDVVQSLVYRQHLAELDSKLKRLHTADIAHILDILPIEDRLRIWDLLVSQRGGDILLEASEGVRRSLIQAMSEQQLQQALQQMDGEDLAYIAEDIPEPQLQARLDHLSSEEQDWAKHAMEYNEDQVGHLMTREMVVIREHNTLAQAETLLRELKTLPIHTDKLFVVDGRGILTGVLSLQNILVNDAQQRVSAVMATEVVRFSPDDHAGDASKAFERYDLISAPVINHRGKLIGRLTVDVVMDYIRDESSENVLNMAGVSGEEDLFASFWSSARNRIPWLMINLFTAFVASSVIGLFEDTILHLVALAALMPIVASVGGNTGNQTAALIIRALAQGQITNDNSMRLVRKEMSVSAINGLMLGLVVAVFTLLLYGDVHLAVVIAAAMLLTLIIAALFGLAVPVYLHRSGRDPALGSSVITTAATDSIGFLVFLGLASMFLV